MSTTDPTHLAARQNYNRLSRWYDLFSSEERAIQRQALKLLNPQPGEAILEIGCGTGHLLSGLAKQIGQAGLAVGVDISHEMGKVVARRLHQKGHDRQSTAITGDAVSLPFRSDSFHAAISTFTLELFSEAEIEQVLAELRRVLKTTGRMVIASLNQPDTPSRAVSIYQWFHTTFPHLVDCRPIPVAEVIQKAGMVCTQRSTVNLWGLPVEIIACQRQTK